MENADVIGALANLNVKMDEISKRLAEMRDLIGPFGVPLPDDTMLVQTLWGIKLKAHALDLIMTPQLIIYRQWEADLSSALVGAAERDTVFVDVGANIGYFTTLLASRIGQGGAGRVIAIEPNPQCLTLLRQNITINWSLCPITVHSVAVSDHDGEANLSIPSNRAANAYLGDHGDGEMISVRLQLLDDVLRDVESVDLLKIDVEGHEYRALLGASRAIARSRNIVIVMEWSTSQLAESGTTPDQMIQLFESLGLVPCRIGSVLRRNELLNDAYDINILREMKYNNIALVHAKPV